MDDFYNNIIYKKNAIKDLEHKLKTDFCKKRILCVFSERAKRNNFSSVVNILNKAMCSYDCVTLNKSPFVKDEEIKEIFATKNKNYNLIIGIGGGGCSDAVKILANKYGCESIFVVANFGNMSFFNNISILEQNGVLRYINGHEHNFVYIDEGWVKNFSKSKYEDCIMFLNSLVSVLDDFMFYKFVYNMKINFDCIKVKELLKKMNYELSILSNCEEKNLCLQDYVVDISFEVKDVLVEFYNFIKLANIIYRLPNTLRGFSFCQLCHVGAVIIEKFYSSFYEIKHIQLFEPYNILNKVYLSNKFKIELNLLKNIENKYFYNKNKLFFQKINAIKKNMKMLTEESNNILQITKTVVPNPNISCDDVFDCFKILPLVYDCGMVVGLINRTGLLNH